MVFVVPFFNETVWAMFMVPLWQKSNSTFLFAQRQPLIPKLESKGYQNHATRIHVAVSRDGVNGHRAHNRAATEHRPERMSAHVPASQREDKRGYVNNLFPDIISLRTNSLSLVMLLQLFCSFIVFTEVLTAMLSLKACFFESRSDNVYCRIVS